jgi:hypothetical protein
MDNIEANLESIKENLINIIKDFTNDLSETFPEYNYLWKKWNNPLENDIEELTTHISSIFPQRFFDILYKNVEIFNPDNEIDTVFIPGVDFKLLFNCQGVSDQTKDVIWKYLQLVLFTIIGSVKNKDDFGDISSLFEGIHENDLHEKMEEAFNGLDEFFTNINLKEEEPNLNTNESDDKKNTEENSTNNEEGDGGLEDIFDNIPNIPGMPGIANMAKNMAKGFDFKKLRETMPNMDKMKDHLKTVFEGKIGKMATELAEEISTDINSEFGSEHDVKTSADVIKKIIKNPKKMMEIIKKVGGKIGDKIKTGELSKDDIMKEATEIMEKMKEMGGGEQFESMLKTMAKQMGGNINMSAMNNEMKKHSMKEKLRARMEKKKQMMEMQQAIVGAVQNEKKNQESSSNNKEFVFKIDGESQQKTSIKQFAKETAKKQEEELDALVSELNIVNEKDISKKKTKKGKK